MIRLACVVCLLCASLAEAAEPRCRSVFLPELGPPEGQATPEIRKGFPVPPSQLQPEGAFYPVHLQTTTSGSVVITQTVGEAWARDRRFEGVTSVSLVFWRTRFDPALENYLLITGYKILPNTAAIGVEPTWAYRETEVVDWTRAYFNMSTPLQMGEAWDFSIANFLDYTVWIQQAQIEAMICR